jgi:Lysophospholipase catalytic domain
VATSSPVSGSFSAQVFPSTGPGQTLTVSEFINIPRPGNVAVCLSGGGSRAMSAGMGQLNALETARLSLHGSLLSHVKALSTVSGGSWLGVPFVYLPSSISDSDFLGGPYVDPSQLTPAGLATFPPNCIGAQITTDFTIEHLLGAL